MKKVLFIIAASVVVGLSACNTQTENKSQSTESAENTENTEVKTDTTAAQPADSVVLENTFSDGASFSVAYPEVIKAAYTDETTFTGETADKDCRIDVVFKSDEPDMADLLKYSEIFKENADEDEKFEEPKVEGNVLTMRSLNMGEVGLFFVVLKDKQSGVVGKYHYRETRAADFDKYFNAIVKSVAFK